MSMGEFTTSTVNAPAVQAKMPEDKARITAHTFSIELNMISPLYGNCVRKKAERSCNGLLVFN
jgi:hypothetical protein